MEDTWSRAAPTSFPKEASGGLTSTRWAPAPVPTALLPPSSPHPEASVPSSCIHLLATLRAVVPRLQTAEEKAQERAGTLPAPSSRSLRGSAQPACHPALLNFHGRILLECSAWLYMLGFVGVLINK